MTPEQYQRVRELFHTASELAATPRRAFLDRECGGDGAVRAEVESLLSHHDADGPGDAFAETRLGFGRALIEDSDGPEDAACHPERLGAYRLIERIGEGGMGVVYKAEQENPRRIVALKIMRRLGGPSALRRFEFEAQLLGELQHPGIAQVFEAAVFDDGIEKLPYFVMELIAGAKPLTRYADAAALKIRQRLQLFATICDAVQHGHQHGVIHRDLKPENILIGDAGRPKIIDFGVARVTNLDGAGVTATATGHLIGTLAYMSPEQLDGDTRRIDTRADVYALGVVLYELLSGALPLDVSDTSIPEACRIIREQEPTPLHLRDPHLRGDVELIVAKAIEKDKERRYASAGELAADIRRHLRNEPITARPPTLIYQFRKFARRNRGLVFGVSATLASLFIGLAIAVVMAVLATRARDDALRETYRSSIAAAASALEKHDVALARRSLMMAPESLRAWEWNHLFSRLDESVLAIPTPNASRGAAPMFVRSDADPIVQLYSGKGSKRWNAATGVVVDDQLTGSAMMALDHAGEYEATITGGSIVVRNTATGESHSWNDANASLTGVKRIAVSDGGRYVATVSPTAVARFDLQTGRRDETPIDDAGTGVDAVALTRDGNVVLASAYDGMPALWAPGGPLSPFEGSPGFARSVDVSPDGLRIVIGLQDATVRLWRANDRALLHTGRGHKHAVTGVAFSPDGSRIASVSLDRTVRLWDAVDMSPFATLHGHDRGVWNVAFSEDGGRLATTGEDGTIRIWDARRREGKNALFGHQGFVYCVAFSPDSQTLASAGWDKTIRLWNAATCEPQRTLNVDTDVITAMSFSSDGRYLVWIGNSAVGAWDLHDNQAVVPTSAIPLPAATTIKCLEFVADTTAVPLPWTWYDGNVDVWNVGSNAVETWSAAELLGRRADFLSADGNFAVGVESGDRTGDVRTARRDSGSPLLVVDLRNNRTVDVPEFSGPFALNPARGGPPLLAARRADDMTRVEVWDLATPQKLGTLIGHTDDVYAVAYSPNGSRIATAGRDSLRLWDAKTFAEIVQLRGHTSFVWALAFSPDGRRLASGSGDSTVRIWETGPPRATQRK